MPRQLPTATLLTQDLILQLLHPPPPIQATDLTVQLCSQSLKSTSPESKAFGTVFTDHMLTIEWSEAEGWGAPHIQPLGNLSVHPACSSLHYGIQVRQTGPAGCCEGETHGSYGKASLSQLFEGLKVYPGEDERLRLFRPMLNLKRMSKSARRVCLPVSMTGCRARWGGRRSNPPSTSPRPSTRWSCWSASGDWWRSSRTGLLSQARQRISMSDQHLSALR